MRKSHSFLVGTAVVCATCVVFSALSFVLYRVALYGGMTDSERAATRIVHRVERGREVTRSDIVAVLGEGREISDEKWDEFWNLGDKKSYFIFELMWLYVRYEEGSDRVQRARVAYD